MFSDCSLFQSPFKHNTNTVENEMAFHIEYEVCTLFCKCTEAKTRISYLAMWWRMAFLRTIQSNVVTSLASSVLNGCNRECESVVTENEGVPMFVVLLTPRSKWAPLKKGTNTDLC